MALTAIHPGEHLAEELEALNMSAAELARQLKVPTNRITQWSALHYRRYRFATGSLLRYDSRVLVELTEPV